MYSHSYQSIVNKNQLSTKKKVFYESEFWACLDETQDVKDTDLV